MAEKDMQNVFETFVKADGSKDGNISLDGIKKWFKESAVISEDTGITESDVEAVITNTVKDKKSLDFEELQKCVKALAKEKKIEKKELIEKLAKPVKIVPEKKKLPRSSIVEKDMQNVFKTFVAGEGMKTVFDTFVDEDGKIHKRDIKKWFKEASVIGKDTGITENDVDVGIGATVEGEKLDFDELQKLVTRLAKEKNIEPKEFKDKLAKPDKVEPE